MPKINAVLKSIPNDIEPKPEIYLEKLAIVTHNYSGYKHKVNHMTFAVSLILIFALYFTLCFFCNLCRWVLSRKEINS